MEAVGARLGRSSTRYGPAIVFTGPVRKWKKTWVPMPSSNSNHHNHATASGTVNGTYGSSHLLVYKWTPVNPNDINNNLGNSVDNGIADSGMFIKEDKQESEDPPRKKFKHIPIIVFEEQENESSEQIEVEAEPNDNEGNTADITSKTDSYNDKKPDINDVPVDESQASENNPVEHQDLNESTLDLSLGLNAHDREAESGSKAEVKNSLL